MKSQSLQELVKSIFSDEKAKSEFLSNPDRVLNRYNLTEQEKKAVLTTHVKLGLVCSDSQILEANVGPTDAWFSPKP